MLLSPPIIFSLWFQLIMKILFRPLQKGKNNIKEKIFREDNNRLAHLCILQIMHENAYCSKFQIPIQYSLNANKKKCNKENKKRWVILGSNQIIFPKRVTMQPSWFSKSWSYYSPKITFHSKWFIISICGAYILCFDCVYTLQLNN